MLWRLFLFWQLLIADWDAELGVSGSSLATRLPCLCPLICIHVRCAGTQVNPQKMRSSSRSLFSFVLPRFIFLQSRSSYWFSGHKEVQPFLSLWLSLPLSLSNSISFLETNCRESQKDGGLDSTATEMVFPASILPAWNLKTQKKSRICMLTQNMRK